MKPRAGVLGAGVAGLASARALIERGWDVSVFSADVPPNARSLDARFYCDADAKSLAQSLARGSYDLVVVSPGIAPHSPLMSAAHASAKSVVGDAQMAWDLSRHPTRWLCITGTNGKTTTTQMLNAILQSAGMTSAAVGNIGLPIIQAVDELDTGADALAVELSSAQLQLAPRLAPWASVCLNVDSDHLDWHGSTQAYLDAKARVYAGAVNARFYFADDAVVAEMVRKAQDLDPGPQAVPLVVGDAGRGQIGVRGGKVTDNFYAGGEVVADLREAPLLRALPDGAPLMRDAVAAIALARSVGVKAESIARAMASFQPDAHRGEHVEVGEVRWVDNSKATNVHAAMCAAREVEPGRLVWLVGGDAKGQDLRPLFEEAALRAKALVLIGEAPRVDLAEEFAPNVPVWVGPRTSDGRTVMERAVRACAEFADAGDTVLLAPGCASWDQFDNYGQRGQVFLDLASSQMGKERSG